MNPPPTRRHADTLTRMILLWLPVVLWAGVIFYLSGIPYLRITAAWYDLILRKFAHMFEFALLARLLSRALTGSTFWPWKNIFWSSLALSFLYACSDEYHQTFSAGRVGCAKDVLIDTVAAWLALGVKP